MRYILSILLFWFSLTSFSQSDNPDFLKEFKAEFDAFISKGDSCFFQKKYRDASSFYESATQLEPIYLYSCIDTFCVLYKEELVEARKKHDIIKQILWNDELLNITGDSLEKYNGYVKLGDLFAADSYNRYEHPIQAYLRALKMKPNETYPIEQIRMITERLYSDSMRIRPTVLAENCHYLMRLKKYGEAENYLKSETALLDKTYVNTLNSLNETIKRINTQLNLLNHKNQKVDEKTETAKLQKELQIVTQQKWDLEASQKSIYEISAKYLAAIQAAKATK